MHRRPLAIAVVALALALAGCNSGDPAPTASSTASTLLPSSAPASPTLSVSATKPLTPAQQDLQSAGEAVTSYWRVLDDVASNPKVSLNVLATVARSQALEQWQTTLSEFRTKQWTQEGVSVVRDIDPATNGESFTVQHGLRSNHAREPLGRGHLSETIHRSMVRLVHYRDGTVLQGESNGRQEE